MAISLLPDAICNMPKAIGGDNGGDGSRLEFKITIEGMRALRRSVLDELASKLEGRFAHFIVKDDDEGKRLFRELIETTGLLTYNQDFSLENKWNFLVVYYWPYLLHGCLLSC